MRTASLRTAALLLILTGCPRSPATPAPEPVPVNAEEARYRARADEIRRRLLATADWAELGDDRCNPGVLRTFGSDSASARQTEALVEELERIIIARGIDNPLDTRAEHDLLRTVIAWEADLARPRWDVPAGEQPRTAIAPGLAGEFRNPDTGQCERFTAQVRHTVIVPEVPGFEPARLDTSRVQVFIGPTGLNRARDLFFQHSTDADPIFSYTNVRVAVVWGDYAVVAVNRPAEHRGAVPLSVGAGGASYVFHRAGGEWRLLAIARTWG